MRRHEQRVTVTEEHEVIVRLPSDFPPGEAEIVVLSKVKEPSRGADLAKWLDEWTSALPKAPSIPLTASRVDARRGDDQPISFTRQKPVRCSYLSAAPVSQDLVNGIAVYGTLRGNTSEVVPFPLPPPFPSVIRPKYSGSSTPAIFAIS